MHTVCLSNVFALVIKIEQSFNDQRFHYMQKPLQRIKTKPKKLANPNHCLLHITFT